MKVLIKLEFSRHIFDKPPRINIHKKNPPVTADLFRGGRGTGRRTDMTKLRVAFWNFANGPKNKILTEIEDY